MSSMLQLNFAHKATFVSLRVWPVPTAKI